VLDADVEVRVWDSTAELRYLVIPRRPVGTDGWTEEQLAELVTRNSMIGTEVLTPVAASPGGTRDHADDDGGGAS
jgi:nitrile hydratase